MRPASSFFILTLAAAVLLLLSGTSAQVDFVEFDGSFEHTFFFGGSHPTQQGFKFEVAEPMITRGCELSFAINSFGDFALAYTVWESDNEMNSPIDMTEHSGVRELSLTVPVVSEPRWYTIDHSIFGTTNMWVNVTGVCTTFGGVTPGSPLANVVSDAGQELLTCMPFTVRDVQEPRLYFLDVGLETNELAPGSDMRITVEPGETYHTGDYDLVVSLDQDPRVIAQYASSNAGRGEIEEISLTVTGQESLVFVYVVPFDTSQFSDFTIHVEAKRCRVEQNADESTGKDDRVSVELFASLVAGFAVAMLICSLWGCKQWRQKKKLQQQQQQQQQLKPGDQELQDAGGGAVYA